MGGFSISSQFSTCVLSPSWPQYSLLFEELTHPTNYHRSPFLERSSSLTCQDSPLCLELHKTWNNEPFEPLEQFANNKQTSERANDRKANTNSYIHHLISDLSQLSHSRAFLLVYRLPFQFARLTSCESSLESVTSLMLAVSSKLECKCKRKRKQQQRQPKQQQQMGKPFAHSLILDFTAIKVSPARQVQPNCTGQAL